MANDSVIQVRLNAELKQQASAVFKDMGLSVSEGIRLVIAKIAAQGSLSKAFFDESTEVSCEYQYKTFNDIRSQLEYSTSRNVNY